MIRQSAEYAPAPMPDARATTDAPLVPDALQGAAPDASGVRTRGAEGASAAVSSSDTRSVKEEKDQVVPHLRRPDHDGDAPPDDTGGAQGPLPGLPADRHRAHDHACLPVGGAHRWCRAGRAVARGRTR